MNVIFILFVSIHMQQKKVIIIIAVAVLILAGLGFFFFSKKSPFKGSNESYTGKKVSVNYVGKYPDGKAFDTNIESVAKEVGLYDANRPYSPLQFVVGSGQVVAGFENAIAGMAIGDTKKVTIEPKDAYGEYDDKKIATLPKSLFQEAGVVPEVGQTYQMGAELIKVSSMTETGVIVDRNHPMAGKTLVFDITLLSAE